MKTWGLDEQFFQAAMDGDATTIKKYLEPKYQIAQLYEWPARLRFRSFIHTPSIEICEMLYHTGVTDINAYITSEELEKFRWRESHTALTLAVLQNNVKKVQWLLNKSADFNKPYLWEVWDAQGYRNGSKTPLELAREKGFSEIANLLKSAGAKE